MTWLANIASVLAVAGLVSARCGGMSDACALNPILSRQDNVLNYQIDSCNLKWKQKCTTVNKRGELQQKPPPYLLCNSWGEPSGQIPVDVYTLAMQARDDDSPANSADYTLHGLWPGSSAGKGAKNQPYGCLNGEPFDEKLLTTFHDLLNYYWPTNPKYKNTMQCFILSEWMKHGTCAVIAGADGKAFRLSQEAYFRTAFVFAHEFNKNPDLRSQLKATGPDSLEPLIPVNCVQCAYVATVGWKGTDISSVPRMPSECIDQCFSCGKTFDLCPPAFLRSTVKLDPSNAPRLENSDSDNNIEEAAVESFPVLQHAVPGFLSSDKISPWEGTWRSFGAEQGGSGKFEFAQTFSDNTLTVTTDSPYPSKCKYEPNNLKELVLHCEGAKPHLEGCLVQRLPDVGGLEAAFLACNHTGEIAPGSFFSAMDTPGCGNFLMFRCKAHAEGCAFSPDAISAQPDTKTRTKPDSESESVSPVIQSKSGLARPPNDLLGVWRSLQVSSNYENGLVTWSFTSDSQAVLQWPNYPSRAVERFSVSHSPKDPNEVHLTSASGSVTTCRFEFQYQPVYSYAVLNCEDKKGKKHTKWAMGRCNPCSASCRYSCTPANNNCGYGSCDPADKEPVAFISPSSNDIPKWCTPEDPSCWPTKKAIWDLEQALDPTVPRLGVRWDESQPQPAPVPTGSFNNQSFYGLGSSPAGLKALYYYENIDEMQHPCFVPSKETPATWNVASDMCKAALHNNEYRNWNPYIVVFPLNERHVTAALEFATNHRLCIATAGTGHEYNSRNSCPTGGILIRTILLKDKTFIPDWKADPDVAPDGAFRFGAGSIFAEMHNFSAKYDRVIASGWCSTVGMAGFHLGGGHGPFAPSMGLGVDNVLEIELLQVGRDAHGRTVVHKKIVNRHQNPQLFWAMRGGGGGVWGVILSMTLRAHAVPKGGISRVYMDPKGTFCQDGRKFGYEWLRKMWPRFAEWQMRINQKVSTQPGFFINTDNYKKGDLCSVTWEFKFEYIYAGGQEEADYKLFRDGLKEVLHTRKVTETKFKSAYEYVLSMPANKFQIPVTNPLPEPHPPSDAATGSQNSVFVSREAMEKKFATTMMDVLDICVESLKTPDDTSPAANGTRCGFHYLYTSVTGNLGSVQPDDTAIAPGFRKALMLWNARTLSTKQADETIYKLGSNSYFSESSYVMHKWTDRYWGRKRYEQLLAVKRAHDPGNRFWCHHCVGDNPDDAYGDPLGVYADSDKRLDSDMEGDAYKHDEL
ncbi:unnamed protein product [Fusarium equiseti]|uniref:FAD-binding PCMH-type domain-containing protein n=1 Tax=Fusarium equiseti TaxID=61235 RepID=A0A8J2IM01_FUSEQ|nr:unnamed protein product [Fusarium equiseti]